jgi:hypothetical protein
MFKKLMIRLRKRAFGSSVVLHCNRLLYDFLESDNYNDGRKEIQEIVGNHCFDIIRKKGSQAIADFRKEMIETVLGIVQSDNPITNMRKELIRTIHSDILNKTFFSEKFYDRRQELYEGLNHRFDNTDIMDYDEKASVVVIRCEAKSCILRLLQSQYFEETGEDDWFSNYSKVYQTYMEMLFELILSKKDEKDFSVNGMLFTVLKKQLESYQQNLIGESGLIL